MAALNIYLYIYQRDFRYLFECEKLYREQNHYYLNFEVGCPHAVSAASAHAHKTAVTRVLGPPSVAKPSEQQKARAQKSFAFRQSASGSRDLHGLRDTNDYRIHL